WDGGAIDPLDVQRRPARPGSSALLFGHFASSALRSAPLIQPNQAAGSRRESQSRSRRCMTKLMGKPEDVAAVASFASRNAAERERDAGIGGWWEVLVTDRRRACAAQDPKYGPRDRRSVQRAD